MIIYVVLINFQVKNVVHLSQTATLEKITKFLLFDNKIYFKNLHTVIVGV